MPGDPSNNKFKLRNLRVDDIPKLISLPRDEGREMGQESEIQTWLTVDPNGIFVVENLEDGKIAGSCSGIALTEEHGYIGMYVVKNEFRGLGVGRILWNAALNRLGTRNISLSSAEPMLRFYCEKAGFCQTAKWTVNLYTSTNPVLPSIVFSRPMPYAIVVKPGSRFVQYIIDYDFSIHRYDRSVVVNETINEVGTVTLMSVSPTVGKRLKTTGYACMKKSLQGHWMIAPVYANDYASARSLVHGLMSTLSEDQRREGVVAKLVSSNCEAAKLFLELGLKKSDYKLYRLSTKEVFEIPETKVFALQSSVFCTE